MLTLGILSIHIIRQFISEFFIMRSATATEMNLTDEPHAGLSSSGPALAVPQSKEARIHLSSGQRCGAVKESNEKRNN